MTRQLNDNNKLFLKLIFGARKKAGLTQKKLADMLKKNQSYYYCRDKFYRDYENNL